MDVGGSGRVSCRCRCLLSAASALQQFCVNPFCRPVLLWRTLTALHTGLEINFLPVYYPNEQERNDAKLYALNVRNYIAQSLGIPGTEHGYNDCKLMNYMIAIGMPYFAWSHDIAKMRRWLG